MDFPYRFVSSKRNSVLAWCLAATCAAMPLPALCDIVTQYRYDAGDHVAAVTDPRGLVTTYTYDGLGQPWQQVSPDTGITRFTYSVGYKTSMTRPDGTRTDYGYDGLGRLSNRIAGGRWQEFLYDSCVNGKGRLCGINDSGGMISYAYTPEGWLSTRSFIVGLSPYALNYTYTSTGALASIVYPDQSRLMYAYANGVVNKMTLTRGQVMSAIASNITYRPGNLGMASWTSANGLVNTLSYDSDSRLTGIQVPGIQSLSFRYDPADRITQIGNGVDSAMTQNIGYDTLSRLSTIASPADNETFQYDANGNRTQQQLNGAAATTVIGSGSNRLQTLVSADTSNYDYDAQGNLVTVSKPGFVVPMSGGSNAIPFVQSRFGYDPFNRLSSANDATYYVGAEGQRLSKRVNTVTTYFAPDASGPLLAEYSAGGTDESWSNYFWLNGRLVGRVARGAIESIHGDQTGRPEVVTSSGKAIVWRARNFAFDRAVTLSTTAALNLGFPGQYYDAESGLWNNGFRDYSPSLGRYIESDPIGLEGGINTYAYVGGNPLSRIDPLGLTEADVILMTALVRTNESDLKVPNGPIVWFKDVNLSGNSYAIVRQEGTYQEVGDSMSLSDRYLGQLSKQDLLDLYDTIVHESLHKTCGHDSAKPKEHFQISQTAHQRTNAAATYIGQYFGYGL